MRWTWMIVPTAMMGACSGSGSLPAPPSEPAPEEIVEAPTPRAPSPGPATTATAVGSCTIVEFGSCQTFYSDSPLAATAAAQCADNQGIWSDVCPTATALAICVTLDGRPLGAFYPPQPMGDFGAGCTQLGGRLAE